MFTNSADVKVSGSLSTAQMSAYLVTAQNPLFGAGLLAPVHRVLGAQGVELAQPSLSAKASRSVRSTWSRGIGLGWRHGISSVARFDQRW